MPFSWLFPVAIDQSFCDTGYRVVSSWSGIKKDVPFCHLYIESFKDQWANEA